MAARGYTVASAFQGASKNRPLRNLLKVPVGGTWLWGASITGGKIVVTYQYATNQSSPGSSPAPFASPSIAALSLQPSSGYCRRCGSHHPVMSTFCASCGAMLGPLPSSSTLFVPDTKSGLGGGRTPQKKRGVQKMVVAIIAIGGNVRCCGIVAKQCASLSSASGDDVTAPHVLAIVDTEDETRSSEAGASSTSSDTGRPNLFEGAPPTCTKRSTPHITAPSAARGQGDIIHRVRRRTA